jgi:hypothetical protein
MKKVATHEFALMEMIELLEHGYHMAYCDDYGDYFTVVLTNDNGEMDEKDIKDRFFDFEYVEVEEEC